VGVDASDLVNLVHAASHAVPSYHEYTLHHTRLLCSRSVQVDSDTTLQSEQKKEESAATSDTPQHSMPAQRFHNMEEVD
jgi:hypothetical protein